MSEDQHVDSRSEIEDAIDRALEAANLRPGDATTTPVAFVGHAEPSAVELDGGAGAGAGAGGADGD
ncbi:hypothetical protein [Microbacterium flavescens]|uniref:hypothetical protein n=1 Tax=Microbacterium flavescens TaxID=69366 RepID=UPI001BDDCC70|nr:hypothetical protein [Microbacterium flavescens]BFF09683.1 hypothetical protein GCM10025699_09860 [Microbacterium flavescens]BFF09686.1 hypothetical protein GCM10025699_09890 [Microbacterium flavescens]